MVPYVSVAVTLSGILKAKQKLGVTFNSDKQDVIDLKKFSKLTMCRASEVLIIALFCFSKFNILNPKLVNFN